MGDLLSRFSADMAAGPAWLGLWVNIMGPIILLSIPLAFIRRNLIPATLLLLLGMASTLILYANFGYERILGLGHVVFWTPALIYLYRIRSSWKVKESWVGKWIVLGVLVILISLAFDYVDVARWMLGEKT